MFFVWLACANSDKRMTEFGCQDKPIMVRTGGEKRSPFMSPKKKTTGDAPLQLDNYAVEPLGSLSAMAALTMKVTGCFGKIDG